MYYQDHLQTLQVLENKVFNWISEPCRPSWKSRNLMGFQHFKNSLRLSKVSVRNSNNQNSKSLVRKKKASLVKSVSRGLQHCPKSIFYSDHLKLDVPPTPLPPPAPTETAVQQWLVSYFLGDVVFSFCICWEGESGEGFHYYLKTSSPRKVKSIPLQCDFPSSPQGSYT